MKTHTLKRILVGAFLATSFLAGAEKSAGAASALVPESTQPNMKEVINIAGKQRMLSQRIAKDYLYIGKNVAVDKATRQLKKSLELFTKSQNFLKEFIPDPEIRNLIAFVNLSKNELEEIAKKPFSLDNAQLILDLSESMLEGSQYIVDSLKNQAKQKDSAIVATSGKQRMLAQRIAKYYIAYQSGIKDKNTVNQMKAAVKLFDDNSKVLMNNAGNTERINQELQQVNSLWKIVHKFYLNIEKGGLPFIVFTSTDDITKKMDVITKEYSRLKR